MMHRDLLGVQYFLTSAEAKLKRLNIRRLTSVELPSSPSPMEHVWANWVDRDLVTSEHQKSLFNKTIF